PAAHRVDLAPRPPRRPGVPSADGQAIAPRPRRPLPDQLDPLLGRTPAPPRPARALRGERLLSVRAQPRLLRASPGGRAPRAAVRCPPPCAGPRPQPAAPRLLRA